MKIQIRLRHSLDSRIDFRESVQYTQTTTFPEYQKITNIKSIPRPVLIGWRPLTNQCGSVTNQCLIGDQNDQNSQQQLQSVRTLCLQHRCSRLDWCDCFVKLLNNQGNSGNLRVLFLSKDFDTPFSDPDLDTLFFRFGNYYSSAYFHSIINIWKMDLPDDLSLHSSKLDECCTIIIFLWPCLSF